jgi:hypothetical protein
MDSNLSHYLLQGGNDDTQKFDEYGNNTNLSQKQDEENMVVA